MELRKLFTDERAVSPVVGVALLIAIAVILAAVIGAVVLGLGTGGAETPQAQLQADYNSSAGEWTVSHQGGEPLPADEIAIVDGDGATIEENPGFTDGEFTAGESYTFATSKTSIAIVWDDPNSDTETVLEEFSD